MIWGCTVVALVKGFDEGVAKEGRQVKGEEKEEEWRCGRRRGIVSQQPERRLEDLSEAKEVKGGRLERNEEVGRPEEG